jgi:hypothetical protein
VLATALIAARIQLEPAFVSFLKYGFEASAETAAQRHSTLALAAVLGVKAAAVASLASPTAAPFVAQPFVKFAFT